jgi:hypothetical protein
MFLESIALVRFRTPSHTQRRVLGACFGSAVSFQHAETHGIGTPSPRLRTVHDFLKRRESSHKPALKHDPHHL